MKKLYLAGIIISGALHLPLLKEREYVSYGVATLLWPIPAVMFGMYMHYVLWGTYQHKKKFPHIDELATQKARKIIDDENRV